MDTLSLSSQGFDFIRHWESFSSVVYADAAGYPTIGYGHRVRPGEKFKRITEAQGEQLLHTDVQTACDIVNGFVCRSVQLKQCEFDALVSFVYNVGPGKEGVDAGFCYLVDGTRSTMLRLLQANDKTHAAQEFDRWVYAKGEKLHGLVRRRAAERAMFEGHDWRTAA
jgi:lysozyme